MMATTYTTNTHLALQGTGDNPGTWGAVLNNDALAILDQVLGGVQTLSLSSIPVSVNTAQSQNNAIRLTGTLSANVDVTFPAIGRSYFIINDTTGAFTVTLKSAGGGASLTIPSGSAGIYTFDPTLGVMTMKGDLALGVSAILTAGFIELGALSDTTISRSAAGVIAVEGVPLYSNIPQNSKNANYTTVLADAQKHILHPASDNSARVFTIASNASVPYPVGTAITFINEINTVTIAINSDTLVLAGAGSTGSRTLAANGMATAIKITSTKWVISGAGLS